MVKVVLFGDDEYAVIALQELDRAGAETVALVTHEVNGSADIWHRTPAPSARERGVAVHTPAQPNSPLFVAVLRDLSPDLVLAAGYGHSLSQPLLDLAPLGAIGLHCSLLPRYRGHCPVNWALAQGEIETGVTLHHLAEQADAGDLVAQTSVRIAFEDTAITLHRKLFDASRALLHRWLPTLLNGAAGRRPQDHSQATCFGALEASHGRIDWSDSAIQIHNLVRAFTHPYPGAFTFHHGQLVHVWRARPVFDRGNWGLPGAVLDYSDSGVRVATGWGVLCLQSLRQESGPEWTTITGRKRSPLRPGDVLGQDDEAAITAGGNLQL